MISNPSKKWSEALDTWRAIHTVQSCSTATRASTPPAAVATKARWVRNLFAGLVLLSKAGWYSRTAAVCASPAPAVEPFRGITAVSRLSYRVLFRFDPAGHQHIQGRGCRAHQYRCTRWYSSLRSPATGFSLQLKLPRQVGHIIGSP